MSDENDGPPASNLPRSGAQADFTFEIPGADELTDDLRVVRFAGSEGISELYQFRIKLASRDPLIDAEALLGRDAVLTIHWDGGVRHVNGIIRRFARIGRGSGMTYYSAHLVPRQWLLTRGAARRVFTEERSPGMGLQDILPMVFERVGLEPDSFEFRTSRSATLGDFVMQHRESNMNFVARLLEHEGAFYFFDQRGPGDYKFVIADDPAAYMAIPNVGEVPHADPAAQVEDRLFIRDVSDAHSVVVGTASLDDYNFTRGPRFPLDENAAAGQFTSLEQYEYPAKYVSPDPPGPDPHHAAIRLGEHQSRRRVLRMKGNVRGLFPGGKFRLVDRTHSGHDGEYLVTRLEHRAAQPQAAEEQASGSEAGTFYDVRIHAIPADVLFVPRRRARKPLIAGCETAIVVGPENEEIHTDAYGRVRVQFLWDREGRFEVDSSYWIRVSQGLAGGRYGMLFIPRVGHEVVVSFLDGDPDRPGAIRRRRPRRGRGSVPGPGR